MVERRNLFGTLGNRLDNLPFSGSLGLLTTGASLLEGQPIGQAVQAGLGTYQGLFPFLEIQITRTTYRLVLLLVLFFFFHCIFLLLLL